MPRVVALLVMVALAVGADAQAGSGKRRGRRAAAAVVAVATLALPTASAAEMKQADAPRAAPAAVTVAPTAIAEEPRASAREPRASTREPARPRVSNALRELVREGSPVLVGADPSVLTIESGPDAGHYLVSTGNLSVRRSDDLVSWRKAGPLFKGGKLPAGAVSDFWAPTLSTDGKRFFLRYTARDPSGVLRVRSAVSNKVTGPYRDLGPTVERTPGSVGDIDPSELIDIDGSRWLMWKHDGNSAGLPTPMYIQRLGPHGEHLVGRRYLLTTNDRLWEGISTEAPSAFRRGDFVYFSYAGSMYHTPSYNVGMLRIRAPKGLLAALAAGAPFVKHDGPVARSTSATHVGMAHGDFVLGGTHFMSHGWQRDKIQVAPREVVVRKVTWKKGWPRIHNGHPRAARGR